MATDYLSVHQYAPRPGLRSFLRYQILRRHRSADEDVYYEVIGTYRPDAVRLVTAATTVAISRSDPQSAAFDLALDPHSVMCAELPLRHLPR